MTTFFSDCVAPGGRERTRAEPASAAGLALAARYRSLQWIRVPADGLDDLRRLVGSDHGPPRPDRPRRCRGSAGAKSSSVGVKTASRVYTLVNLSVRVANVPRDRRRRRARARLIWQWSLLVAALLLLGGTILGLAFAGSPERLSAGTQIAGVDVSGLTPGQARSLLEERSRELAGVPVVFTAEGKEWSVRPNAVVVDVDWGAAVAAAKNQGEGFGPIRGLRRLGVRVFGGEVVPRSHVYQSAVDAYVARFARGVDRASVEPALKLRGSEPEIVRGRNGRLLDRNAAEETL